MPITPETGSLFHAETQSVIAAIFWLKTRARWKETSVRELAGKDDGPITVVIQRFSEQDILTHGT